ncbi:MAG: insulinase family protein, partial [Rikenellaceae bacterium]
MKKFTLSTLLTILGLYLFGASYDFNQKIANDPELRTGRLSNGLTYYVRHNALPKNQADFYIISDVGAIQENDAQQGLAHFLEHMAFNGTKNLPGKEAIEYLERIGVKFGTNLNASTSWDVTKYLIKDVPVQRQGVIDSALLILHDWSHYITPQGEEIDKERGVIKEELRTRDGASWRSTMELIKALGRGTMYEHRNLIGTLEGLDSFEHNELIEFYEEWYRPEFQAIIVVGDIDAEAVEKQIIDKFSTIPASRGSAPQKEVVVVPDNEKPIISIYSDVELQRTSANYFIKHRALPQPLNALIGTEYKDVLKHFIVQMQRERFNELSMSSNAPFINASLYIGSVGVIPTLECVNYSVQSRDGELKRGLQAMLTEVKRSHKHGFTEGEMQRARDNIMSYIRRSYTNRDQRLNGSYVQRYINHFRENTPIPSAHDEWRIDSTLVQCVTLSDINKLTKELLVAKNEVITINIPQKDGLEIPTQQDIEELLGAAHNQSVDAYQDNVEVRELIPSTTILPGSKVVEESWNEEAKATVWRLENGVEVVVRGTKLKADEVLLRAYSQGGASLIDDDLYYTAKYMPSIMGSSGLGDFSSIELGKQLSGKIAGAALSVGEYSCGASASSSVADIETMLQLLYLNFSSPRFDKGDYDIFIDQVRAHIANVDSDPDYAMSSRFAKVAYNNSPRRQNLSKDIVNSMDFNSLEEIHTKLFGSAQNYRFMIVGSLDTVALKPLVEKYIGSLRTDNTRSSYADDNVRLAEGDIKEYFNFDMQQPKVSVKIIYSGEMEYNLKNIVTMSYLRMALDNRYLESIREQTGG